MNGWITLIYVTGILIFLAFCVLITSSFYFFNLAIRRSRKEFLRNNKDLEQVYQNAEKERGTGQPAPVVQAAPEVQPAPVEMSGIDWIQSRDYENWTITSEDGLKLTGYYIPAVQDTKKVVILAHGYSSKGKDMGSFAKFYHEKFGYNVLMPDARAHGSSEGKFIGFGWPDRSDYLLWIQKVLERVGMDAQIVLHGISMGAATVMMASGEQLLPKQVRVIVEDCGYTSAHDELAYQLKRMFRLPLFPLLPATSLLTKIRAGYGFEEASAVRQIDKCRLPVLFIHGEEDTFVPCEMVHRLYGACHTEKELYLVKGAGHGMAYAMDKPAYVNKVEAFIGRFIRE